MVAEALNLPTSLEFIGETAYVVTLAGEILRIDNVIGGRTLTLLGGGRHPHAPI